eukprot:TCALIF_01470-PA protein Name:"Similar to spir Protein spire (Drosophila melanogaster)" AED:0.07 eAED:0.11 QI:767/0.83/0.85/1/0.16/0.57/7/0/533
MSLRTLKFGDRTISYDTGLNSLPPNLGMSSNHEDARVESRPTKLMVDQDDGIGSSDDDTISTASSKPEDISEPEGAERGERATPANGDGDALTPFESDSSPNLSDINRKKVIRPDQNAINRLLAFDEEEEDDFEDESSESDDGDDAEIERSPKINTSKKGWHKAIVKDLANLSTSSSGKSNLQRRHSITICESRSGRSRKCSSVSSGSSSGGSNQSTQPNTPQNQSPRHSRVNPPESNGYTLNVAEMHANLHDEFNQSEGPRKNEGFETLNLRLDEVAHIRSVLTKAELEALPIDGNVRESVEMGKVCFLCMKTRFGLFCRGNKCEMCKQLVCQKCHSKMKIPLEHFSNTPVFTLSPVSTHGSEKHPHSLSPKNSSLSPGGGGSISHLKDKKLSLPDSLGILAGNSVGSAPNSPDRSRRGQGSFTSQTQPMSLMGPTISSVSATIGLEPTDHLGPISLPPNQHASLSPYATLPKNMGSAQRLCSSEYVFNDRLFSFQESKDELDESTRLRAREIGRIPFDCLHRLQGHGASGK